MSIDAPPKRDAATVERRLLQIEILDLHARGLLRMPYIQTLIVLGIGLFIVPTVTLSSFLFWAVAPIGAEVLRAVYARSVLQRQLALNPTRAHLISSASLHYLGRPSAQAQYCFSRDCPSCIRHSSVRRCSPCPQQVLRCRRRATSCRRTPSVCYCPHRSRGHFCIRAKRWH